MSKEKLGATARTRVIQIYKILERKNINDEGKKCKVKNIDKLSLQRKDDSAFSTFMIM